MADVVMSDGCMCELPSQHSLPKGTVRLKYLIIDSSAFLICRFLDLHSAHQTSNIWGLSWYLVLGTRYQIPDTKYQILFLHSRTINITMPISTKLSERCQGTCELCSSQPASETYIVSPAEGNALTDQVAICNDCLAQINQNTDKNYWRCLEGSIWNPEPAVQALSYRLLYSINSEDWAAAVLESVELDENTQQWALSAFQKADVHKDAFGNTLENGDTVVLTQALNVKGTSFSAAKGTVVKKIRLVPDNTEQIEGKINEQTIVILCKYVKKN